MLFFILDPFIQQLGGAIGGVLSLLLGCISFTGIFILIFGLFQGFVLQKWHYSEFLIGALIIALVGVEPAWILLTQGFPTL